MIRNIVKIDEEKCDGCGLCVNACAEGAIEIIDGKAKLISETYCDGLGACLGECPQNAITIEQRQADAFDEEATAQHLAQTKAAPPELPCGCPGNLSRQLNPKTSPQENSPTETSPSHLRNWPVQLMLAPTQATYFQHADLLLVADCVPFAFADFHRKYLKEKSVVIGCPKLDDAQMYIEKLTEIIKHSSLKSITVLHMEVPCCSGLTRIAQEALAAGGSKIPAQDITIGVQGDIISQKNL